MSGLLFQKYDEVYCRVVGERSDLVNLAELMTFEVPGARFNPMVQSNQWDGKIRLLNLMTGMMYAGLIEHASKIARGIDIDVEVDPAYDEDPFSTKEATDFLEQLNAPLDAHDYQFNSFVHAIQHRRGIFLSPTSSGKSFMIYMITAYLARKTLIIVPTTILLKQMTKDLKAYKYIGDILQVMAGTEKTSDANIVVSTWQSIYKQPVSYFAQYDVVFGDEVHRFSSKALRGLMEKTTKSKYKFGLTGSLDGSKTHELVLIGLFGPVYVTTTTRELIDRGIVSDISIKVMVFSYSKELLIDLPSPAEYKDEDAFILSCNARNRFIKNLVDSLEGNVIILFRKIEAHGDVLYDMLQGGKKNVHYIHGKIKLEERERIQALAEVENNEAILASDGTFSTGVSINNIQWIIRVNTIKSIVNNVQGIGRGLRKDGKTNHIGYFDLADDLTGTSKSKKKNHLYKHLIERLKIYAKQQLPFKIYPIGLK